MSTSKNESNQDAAEAADSKSKLHFFLYDESEKTSTDLFFVQLLSAVLNTKTLVEVRRIIASSPQQKEYATYPFCTNQGALVPDSWAAAEYVHLAAKAKEDKTVDAEKTGSKNTDGLGSGPHAFYLKKSSKPAEKSAREAPSLEGINSKVPTGRELLGAKEPQYDKLTFNADSWKANAAAEISRASDLNEKQWAIVAKNNALLYGFSIVRQNIPGKSVTATGIENARRQAFQLRQRTMSTTELTMELVNNTEISIRMPAFHIDDASYVSVYQTSNTLQSSLANSSFSETEVKAAIEGGAFGVSIGASAGYGSESSAAKTTTGFESETRMNISYNFPRVVIHLDEDCIELTEHCKTAISQIDSADTLRKFLDRYGQFFASRVQLGGRLYASEEASVVTGSSIAEKSQAMKASASASFSSTYVSASASASYGTKEESQESKAQAKQSAAFSWQATGGDTLLCNSPSDWCPTVASFHHWRITKQDKVSHIIDVIGQLPGYEGVPDRLKSLLNSSPGDGSQSKPLTIVPDKLRFKVESSGFYLFACNYSVSSLASPVIAQLSLSGRYTGTWTTITIGAIAAQYASVGAMTNLADKPESNLSGSKFELTDLSGAPVEKACYETKYFIKNRATELGPAVAQVDGTYSLSATRSVTAISFRNPEGKGSAIAIESGVSVYIVVHLGPNDGDVELGLVSEVPVQDTKAIVVSTGNKYEAVRYTLERY